MIISTISVGELEAHPDNGLALPQTVAEERVTSRSLTVLAGALSAARTPFVTQAATFLQCKSFRNE